MLVVHVHAQVQPDRVEHFLAATLVNAQASLAEPRASARYFAVFPAGREGCRSGSP